MKATKLDACRPNAGEKSYSSSPRPGLSEMSDGGNTVAIERDENRRLERRELECRLEGHKNRRR